jgi:predicted nucleotidyltransferase
MAKEHQEQTAVILQRLCRDDSLAALVLFGSRARGEARRHSDLDLLAICRQSKLEGQELRRAWSRLYRQLADLPLPVDLVVLGSADADRLAGSRWHAVGHAAREGRVLYVAERDDPG